MIRRNFKSFVIDGYFPDNGNSVLAIANHISWWDGFWVEYLNQKVVHRKLYFMMLEEQLRKHWYFKYTGGYSIKKNSRSVLESINYTVQLLLNSNNLVLMFPQGLITSMYNDKIIFEKGIEKILSKIPGDTQIMLIVNLIDYFSDKKPNVFCYYKCLKAYLIKLKEIEKEYKNFYNEVIDKHKYLIS
jgi:hypothetical protein